MEFKLQANQITAMTENGEWAGEVSFPFVDREQRRVVVERVFVVPNFRHHGLAAQWNNLSIMLTSIPIPLKLCVHMLSNTLSCIPKLNPFSCLKIVVQRSCKDGSK